MNWQTQREQFRRCVEEVAGIVSGITDFTSTGLGTWDLRGLVGHFLRAVRTPLSYLELPPPSGRPLPGAAAYVAGYLDLRSADPTGVDKAVAKRGSEELTSETNDIEALIATEAARLDDVLATQQPSRLVSTRLGPMRLDDYMRTRSMEVVIHGLDIARATGSDWVPPTELVGDVVSLLGEVAVLRDSGSDLLLLLSGRISPDQCNALPVLR